MATTPAIPVADTPGPLPVPPLQSGDRLTVEEFERRYSAMPSLKKAELIEGIVYVPSPVSEDHASPHFDFIGWLAMYRFATPGIIGGDNGSLRLDIGSMPQPDAYLRIDERHGGQARLGPDRYVIGAPELIAEVAVTSANYDLREKLNAYRRNEVREYVVWRVWDRAIDWFVLRQGQYEPLLLGEDGICRSEFLPGLWLDPAALLRGDFPAVARAAQQGIASPEHAAFVQKLQLTAAQSISSAPSQI
ncbi:MAG TPA: Uma2 family endonuclease [Dongiaceae bacterium]|nr:Uma2 family endonuclease [Dongiaceae bacterium]